MKLLWTRGQIAACGVIVLFMIILPVIVFPYTQKQVQIMTAQKKVNLISPYQGTLGEKLPIADGIICVQDCEEMKEWETQVPEGFRLIGVDYEVEKDETEGFYFTIQAYLKLPQQEYLEPVSEYRLAEEVGINYEVLQDEYKINGTVQEEGGRFLFLVPENTDLAYFELYHFSWIDGTKVLEGIYEVPVSWR